MTRSGKKHLIFHVADSFQRYWMSELEVIITDQPTFSLHFKHDIIRPFELFFYGVLYQ